MNAANSPLVNALLTAARWTVETVTYAFEAEGETTRGGFTGTSPTVSEWTEQEKQRVHDSFAHIETFIDLDFVEASTTSTAALDFQKVENAGNGIAGYAYYPYGNSSTIVMGAPYISASVSNTLIHEIGHALGLSHTHSGGGGAFPGVTDPYDEGDFGLNNELYSTMSYRSSRTPEYPNLYFNTAKPNFSAIDIAALQEVYGANTSHASGNNVYGETTDLVAIWDTGGIDAIDFSSTNNDAVIDLRAATLNVASGGGGFLSFIYDFVSATYQRAEGAYTIAKGAVIENAVSGGGNDRLTGNGGVNRLEGNDGDDFYRVFNSADTVVESTGEGTDRVASSVDYNLAEGVEVERLTTNGSTGTAAINLTGNSLSQTIYGNAGNNVLSDGGASASGLTNPDVLLGLGGNDTYIVYDSGDTVVETATQGTNDRVAAGTSYDLKEGVHVELFTTTSTGSTKAINLTGNSLSQTIIGNAGKNVLSDGGANASGVTNPDVLRGLGGNDTYIVYDSGDTVIETATQGATDRVAAGTNYDLEEGVHVELITTTSTGSTKAINLTGNSLSQTIIGNAGNNRLDGKGGNDTLNALAGNDTFVFSTALGVTNVDTITSYNVAEDTIELENAVFTGLSTGTLAASAFTANTTGQATDANDRIIYDTDSGILFFDVDGTGAASRARFAFLDTGLALTEADFLVV